MDNEKEFTFTEEEYNEKLQEFEAERMKILRRRKLPESLTLREALNAMTKQEMEDIQYNLNLTLSASVSKLKKSDMVEEIAPEVVKFAGRWFVSAFQEQKDLFDYACQHDGFLTGLTVADYHLDYLRGIGVFFCGMQDGELVWFMPEEIRAEYKKINNGAFADAVNLNTEVMRLCIGMVYYYGLADYDTLYKKVKEYTDAEDLEFADFMGIIFNGGCWYPQVVISQHDMMQEALMNVDALQQARSQYAKLEYADLPYDKAYDAGEEGFVESTEEYRALAQFIMQKKQRDVLAAAEDVRSIAIIIQNGYEMKDIVSFLAQHDLKMDNAEDEAKFHELIGAYYNVLPLWLLKGNRASEAANIGKTVVREGRKVGRNEPCPCGSGKKYKQCCLKNEY